MNQFVKFHVDGGAKPNPGPAGWGFIDETGDRYAAGIVKRATNNAMELRAIAELLQRWPKLNLLVCSDSKYAIGAVTGQHPATSNREVVMIIREAIVERKLNGYLTEFEWIPSAQNWADNICDAAVEQARQKWLQSRPKRKGELQMFNI